MERHRLAHLAVAVLFSRLDKAFSSLAEPITGLSLCMLPGSTSQWSMVYGLRLAENRWTDRYRHARAGTASCFPERAH